MKKIKEEEGWRKQVIFTRMIGLSELEGKKQTGIQLSIYKCSLFTHSLTNHYRMASTCLRQNLHIFNALPSLSEYIWDFLCRHQQKIVGFLAI